jgi:hypothetical protein
VEIGFNPRFPAVGGACAGAIATFGQPSKITLIAAGKGKTRNSGFRRVFPQDQLFQLVQTFSGGFQQQKDSALRSVCLAPVLRLQARTNSRTRLAGVLTRLGHRRAVFRCRGRHKDEGKYLGLFHCAK